MNNTINFHIQVKQLILQVWEVWYCYLQNFGIYSSEIMVYSDNSSGPHQYSLLGKGLSGGF